MKKIPFYLFYSIALICLSCKSVKNILGETTPHEKYAKRLEDKHLYETPEGREWLAVSKRALEDPRSILLPYRQIGYFHADKTHSLALQFKGNVGERIIFDLIKKGNSRFIIFADLFKQDGKTTHLFAADTSSRQFSFDISESGNYILRLQPQLNNYGEYILSISIGPSLGFPVAGSKASVGSYWGDSRDGGKRSHEGVDIFAPKLTPAIAGADGVVTGVKEGGLGGKQVWLRVKDNNTFLYYAHLDKQTVEQGQFIKKGEVVGLVGNTGNAKNTPSHLHFGVYTTNGPINPLPFINQTIKTAATVPARSLSGFLKLIKPQKTASGVMWKVNTELLPLAVNAKGYIAELPNGDVIETPFNAVKFIPKPFKQAIETYASNNVLK